MTVRPATHDDLDHIVQLGERFHAQSPWADMLYEPETVRALLARMIDSDDAALFYNGSGMIGGVLSKPYFGGGLLAQELFWFADKGGRELLDTFEEWAHNAGASGVIMVSLETNERISGVMAKLYERRGYAIRERSYWKAL